MPSFIDITGVRYGKLVALYATTQKKGKLRTWMCRCDCGVEKVVVTGYLTSGRCRSCGCAQYTGQTLDITGQRFGRLVAIAKDKIRTSKNKNQWICRCDCGNEKVVPVRNLTSRHTQSCGCFRKETYNISRKPYGVAISNKIYRTYRAAALRRGYVFELNINTFLELTQNDCHYCGRPPMAMRSGMSSDKGSIGHYLYNGVDRVDNFGGYINGNVVTCCADCNRWKWKMSKGEFWDHAIRIATHFKSKSRETLGLTAIPESVQIELFPPIKPNKETVN